MIWYLSMKTSESYKNTILHVCMSIKSWNIYYENTHIFSIHFKTFRLPHLNCTPFVFWQVLQKSCIDSNHKKRTKLWQMALKNSSDTVGKALKPWSYTGLSEFQIIIVFLNSCMCVCVALPQYILFPWQKCFINDLPRLHLLFEMHWQNLPSFAKKNKKKTVIFKQQTLFLRDSQTSSVAPYCWISIFLVLKTH